MFNYSPNQVASTSLPSKFLTVNFPQASNAEGDKYMSKFKGQKVLQKDQSKICCAGTGCLRYFKIASLYSCVSLTATDSLQALISLHLNRPCHAEFNKP